MKRYRILLTLGLTALLCLTAYLSLRPEPRVYTRAELEELFQKQQVTALQKEFSEKRVLLAEPLDEQGFAALAARFTASGGARELDLDGEQVRISGGSMPDGKTAAFSERADGGAVLMVRLLEDDSAAHGYQQMGDTLQESFYKVEFDTGRSVKLTFEGKKGRLEVNGAA